MIKGTPAVVAVLLAIPLLANAQDTRPRSIPEIARAAKGAVVSIMMSDRDGKPIAEGSGFFVSKGGLILTNYHVIAEGTSALVKLPDGAFYLVDGVVAADKVRDIAVIKARGEGFRALALGNSDRVRVGEGVVAIGNPLSLESSVSNGIVSGIRTDEGLGGKFLQITTPISPGSSGGPLFNMEGEVVGITTMYLKGGENLNFAIPINEVKPLLKIHSSNLLNFPNESGTATPQEQTRAQGTSPSAPVAAPESPVTARGYYQQLLRAGGFSEGLPSYACFSDDPHSDSFFTFTAYAFDPDYYNAQAKVQAEGCNPTDPACWSGGSVGSGDFKHTRVTPEILKLFEIMAARQRTAPYVTFLMRGLLERFSPKAQQFFRSGGRVLEETVYEKGVKVNTLEYQWDGSSWVLSIPPADPAAYTQTSKVLRLSIEPSTMRYADSAAVTITVGTGDTAATDTSNYGPSSGTCEKVSGTASSSPQSSISPTSATPSIPQEDTGTVAHGAQTTASGQDQRVPSRNRTPSARPGGTGSARVTVATAAETSRTSAPPGADVGTPTSFVWGEETSSGAAVSSTAKDPLTGHTLRRIETNFAKVSTQVSYSETKAGWEAYSVFAVASIKVANTGDSPIQVSGTTQTLATPRDEYFRKSQVGCPYLAHWDAPRKKGTEPTPAGSTATIAARSSREFSVVMWIHISGSGVPDNAPDASDYVGAPVPARYSIRLNGVDFVFPAKIPTQYTGDNTCRPVQ
jgi:Trypsin-like peptidase domain